MNSFDNLQNIIEIKIQDITKKVIYYTSPNAFMNSIDWLDDICLKIMQK